MSIPKKISIGFLRSILFDDHISMSVVDKEIRDVFGLFADVSEIDIARYESIELAFTDIAGKLDCLYVNSFGNMSIPFLLREKLELDIPMVFYIHSVVPLATSFFRIIPFIKPYDIILAPSEYAKQAFYKISSAFKVYVVPLTIEFAAVKRFIVHKRAGNKKIITYMGRLEEAKGIKPLIKVFPEIVKHADVYLNIVGPLSGNRMTDFPKSRYVIQLEKMIKKFGLENRVIFTGVKMGADKYRILAKSDAVVNLSLAEEETFGRVNIEALACGVPVVSADWAAAREIIENGNNGFIIDVHWRGRSRYFDRRQFVSAITSLISDRKLSSRMRKNARIFAQKYSRVKVARNLAVILQSVKKKKVGGSRWYFVKDKTVSDFKDLFTESARFFVFCDYRNIVMTFSSMYKTITARKEFRAVTAGNGSGIGGNKTILNIRKDFSFFIMSDTRKWGR